MNKRTKKGTKSFPSKNKKFKEKLFIPKKESEAKYFDTNDKSAQLKLESRNIFDENFLIDFRNNMKTKFKITKQITFYKKTDKNKKNINQKTIEAKTFRKNKTISNKNIKKGKSFNKKIINNKNIKNNNKTHNQRKQLNTKFFNRPRKHNREYAN